MACLLNLENFIIEGDFQVVILSLRYPQNPIDWRILSIIYDIIDSLMVSVHSVKKNYKSVNFCTHLMVH
jgi:hypothetical protein